MYNKGGKQCRINLGIRKVHGGVASNAKCMHHPAAQLAARSDFDTSQCGVVTPSLANVNCQRICQKFPQDLQSTLNVIGSRVNRSKEHIGVCAVWNSHLESGRGFT